MVENCGYIVTSKRFCWSPYLSSCSLSSLFSCDVSIGNWVLSSVKSAFFGFIEDSSSHKRSSSEGYIASFHIPILGIILWRIWPIYYGVCRRYTLGISTLARCVPRQCSMVFSWWNPTHSTLWRSHVQGYGKSWLFLPTAYYLCPNLTLQLRIKIKFSFNWLVNGKNWL